MPSKQNLLPLAGVFSGALVWGLIWYPFRVLQDAGVSGALATLLTYLLAMLCGAFMLPRVWRELRQHHRDGKGRWVLFLALSVGWTNLGYVLAVLHGEVMRVLLLFYLAPLWTILFSYWLLGERLNRYGYLIIALSLGGAFVMLWEPHLGLPLPANLAEWIGLSSGMAFALSNVVSRRAAHLSVEAKSSSVWLGTALLTAPLLLWQGGLPGQLLAINAQTWLILALLGVVLCAVSFVVQYALAYLPANRAIVLFLFELVVAAASAYFLAGEAMQPRDWIGALLIVSASLLSGRLYGATGKTHG
ncbi:MAG: multidrug DMT transporter permease [Gallionellales bacterium RIFCSPLOWO2_12_FULL_59_22]|nr:MAG: multidrug DMT transporter permease [Gallionellales bacterium RIFCSPLOWO2_02_FULL_59_110]OGT05680.1 MAG: multidrug DMT transporter permease [Gallionellales bacterium RIFCSPLOWO2_02_58_13]OGT14642.1 MAG: multidrug DMT transporter permease [Gallionellales bacterium RIFCSPLOWO2_12_FULL_59_22]